MLSPSCLPICGQMEHNSPRNLGVLMRHQCLKTLWCRCPQIKVKLSTLRLNPLDRGHQCLWLENVSSASLDLSCLNVVHILGRYTHALWDIVSSISPAVWNTAGTNRPKQSKLDRLHQYMCGRQNWIPSTAMDVLVAPVSWMRSAGLWADVQASLIVMPFDDYRLFIEKTDLELELFKDSHVSARFLKILSPARQFHQQYKEFRCHSIGLAFRWHQPSQQGNSKCSHLYAEGILAARAIHSRKWQQSSNFSSPAAVIPKPL